MGADTMRIAATAAECTANSRKLSFSVLSSWKTKKGAHRPTAALKATW